MGSCGQMLQWTCSADFKRLTKLDLLHHTHERYRNRNAKWSVEDLVNHFEAYLRMKNAQGVKEVLLILNRMTCSRSNHQLVAPLNCPGAFLLKQMHFCVDLALMLLRRKQEEASGRLRFNQQKHLSKKRTMCIFVKYVKSSRTMAKLLIFFAFLAWM